MNLILKSISEGKKLLKVYGTIVSIQSRIMGMHWENERRKARGESIAYTHQAFGEEAEALIATIELLEY